jgi:4-amino-4-deoxy-L-arabinose transferase-like glycosyltransferase
MASSRVLHTDDSTLKSALWLAVLFASAKVLLTFGLTLYTQKIGYSYFRDEFYYIACGRHLAWGYVDHGPIVAVQARLGEWLFGDSVFAIRILSALAGGLMVFLGGLVTWALGGQRSAQALAMLGLICCPQYIGTDGILSMNSFEPIFWTFCVLALVLMMNERPRRFWWPALGIVCGIGILNKPSMPMFLVALLLGLLCTPERRVLFSRWALVGILLMLVIPLPYVAWQYRNHWPMVEFLHKGAAHHVTLGPLAFFLAQFANMLPLNALLWITGIIALLRGKSIQRGSWLGLAFLFFFAMAFLAHAKDYYLAPAYPALFAAGAIAWEHRFRDSRRVKHGRIFAFPIFEAALIFTTAIILPMASPVLKPDTWVRYTTALHLSPNNTETAASGPLPQFFADRFGWQQEADIVIAAYHSLSPQEQQHVCIFGNNYGETASLDFFNALRQAGLPPAISGHNTYYLWGAHHCDPNVSIAVISDTVPEISLKYSSVEVVGHLDNPYAIPYEHKNIYLLRNRRADAPFVWSDEKHYD